MIEIRSGEELKKFRQGLKLSRNQVNELLGLGTNTWLAWETGRNPLPKHLPALIEYILKHREEVP